jgi:Ni,Fe-hydrogenase III large subunit
LDEDMADCRSSVEFSPGIPIITDDIPILSTVEFIEKCLSLAALSYLPLVYCGSRERLILCIMGSRDGKDTAVFSTPFPEGHSYASLTPLAPVFHIFERELWEEWQIVSTGHPWLKPLRYSDPDRHAIKDYPFFSSASPELHEVAVGPVHAGVIEPGHFRFICDGETVHHLEIQLGYQHRGVMELFLEGDICARMQLAEQIAGDSVIGHGMAYVRLIEALSGITVTDPVHRVRAIALELERIAMHLADLSALAGDIAYLSGLNFFAALRTNVINLCLQFCGSRYGKGWLCPGGINFGIDAEHNSYAVNVLRKVRCQVMYCGDAMFNNGGVDSRFDSTGIVKKADALSLGFRGMVARSCGISRDARAAYPFCPYQDFEPICLESGDVYDRAYLRYQEVLASLEMILNWLSTLPEVAPQCISPTQLLPNRTAYSIVEGWRGEIVHALRTDADGRPVFYRIYDPSFHNWTALALSVRGNGVSDFPVCNKSFNLSYCGHDL